MVGDWCYVAEVGYEVAGEGVRWFGKGERWLGWDGR